MIPLFGRQPNETNVANNEANALNNEANAVNNNSAANPERRSLFSRVLSALSPCTAHRSVLNSVVTTPPTMRTPAGTIHIQDVAPANVPSRQALERDLRTWVRAASRGEQAQRTTAANRIRECIRRSSEGLDLSNLDLTSLPEQVLKNIPSLSHLDISRNRLSVINLSGAQNITNLSCGFNFAFGGGALDISNCHNLRVVFAALSTLSSINVSGCNQLQVLDCNSCRLLQNLNLNSCTQLALLNASHSGLTHLELPISREARRVNELIDYIERHGDEPEMRHAVRAIRRQLVQAWRALAQRPAVLRHLELRGTGVQFDQLPNNLRQNQNIHIDIRPHDPDEIEIMVPPAAGGNNHAQNTHTQSVHASASQSATILKNNNQALSIDQAYDQLSAWVNQLPTENAAIEEGYANEAYKNQAAKEWIHNPQHLSHQDATSGVTVKEFLALTWTAIHDDAQRDSAALLKDARESLRDTLYEIKRGYNLNDDHRPKDNSQTAVNICAGGTFNKLAEKLVSVVKGLSLTMITQETFMLSLESTIRKAAMEAVSKDPKLAESLADNNDILTEDLWNAIKHQVTSEIHIEFKAESHIRGKSIDQLLNENTQFEGALEYFPVIPDYKAT